MFSLNYSLSIEVTNYGATLLSVKVPSKDGEQSEITLNYSTLDDLLSKPNPYYGSTVGRFANRIAGAQFELEGVVRNHSFSSPLFFKFNRS